MTIGPEAARLLLEAGGLAAEDERCQELAPYIADALRGAATLSELDAVVGDAAAAGPPWGGDVDDG